MSTNSDFEKLVMLGVAILGGFVALGVFKFSNFIDVDFSTSLSITLRIVGVLAIFFALVKFNVVSWPVLLPAMISGLAWASLPALDYWSIKELGTVQYGITLGDPKWYSYWYSQIALVASPSIVGYSILYALSR